MADTLETGLHSRESRYREMMLEHIFLSELLQKAWREALHKKGDLVNVIRPDVDSNGYDLVLECGRDTRYVQLTSIKTGKKRVNEKLASKPGGCVIWLVYREDEGSSTKLTYRFFGAGPKEPPPLDDESCTNPETNTETPSKRQLTSGDYDKPTDIDQLFDKLFPEQSG